MITRNQKTVPDCSQVRLTISKSRAGAVPVYPSMHTHILATELIFTRKVLLGQLLSPSVITTTWDHDWLLIFEFPVFRTHDLVFRSLQFLERPRWCVMRTVCTSLGTWQCGSSALACCPCGSTDICQGVCLFGFLLSTGRFAFVLLSVCFSLLVLLCVFLLVCLFLSSCSYVLRP